MLGMGLNAQAQEPSRLFFFGFEDGMASFQDSANPLDSIKKVRYYATNPNDDGDWTIVYELDTTMYLLNGIAPLNSRGDTYEIMEDDEDGNHRKTLEKLGAEGGSKYFKYTSGGEAGGSESNNYDADLFIRGVQIKDNTSYRLVYYVKGDANSKMYVDLMRGYYSSEKPFAMDGSSTGSDVEFSLHKTSFSAGNWERVTMMSYYQTDSVAERHMYKNGYWWANTWTHYPDPTDSTKTYQYIEQFDKYFVRLAFSGPGSTYYVDDIALYESWIGGAEYNNYIIRVNFGYQTNLATLAKADVNGSLVLPGDYFSVTGIDVEDREGGVIDVPVESAEYHTDGYLYIWLEDPCDWYEDLRVSFTNPEDPALQLKYTGTLYPMANDTAWVKAGKLVPNFQNEFVVYNPTVMATSYLQLPPLVTKAEPEEGSFTLSPDTKSIKVYFSKAVYVDMEKGVNTEKGVIGRMKGSGLNELWIPGEYNKEDMSVVFTRPAGNTTPLNGDFEFTVMNMRATSSSPLTSDDKVIKLSFGPADVAPVIFGQADFASLAKGTKNVEGFEVNADCMMEITTFTGLYSKALKFGLFGTSGLSDSDRPQLTYTFNVTQPGEWLVKIGTSGCLKSSYNDDCKMEIRVMDSECVDTLHYYVENQSGYKPEEGGAVTEIEDLLWTVNFAKAGQYVIQFRLPNEHAYGGSHKGGRVLYYLEVSNNYSSAYAYIDKFNKAYAAAQEKQAEAFATAAKYTGSVYESLVAIIKNYAGFADTKPSRYNTVVDSLNTATANMTSRISLVDKYYTEYAAAEAKRDQYAEAAEKDLVAYAALVAKINEYASLDPTAKSNDEMTAITSEVTAATKTVTDRVNNNAAFESALAAVKAILDNEDNAIYADFEEFVNAQKAYNAEKDDNLITISDDDLAAATKALTSVKNAFNGKVEGVKAMTVQVKALAELAEAIEVDFEALKAGSAADIEARLATVVDDDQELAEIIKAAIKYTIYKKIAEGELDLAGDSIDVTPFIRNYNLYTTAANGVDMAQFYYSYGAPNDRWRVKTGTFETVFPGWTIQGKSGNVHIGSEELNWVSEDKAPIFDAFVGLDWNSSCVLSGTVEGLPAGKYSIGLAVNTQIDGSKMYVNTSASKDTVNVAQTGSSDHIEVANIFAYDVDAADGTVSIRYEAASGSGWARMDNFAAILTGVADVDYAKLVEEAEAAAKEGLNSVEAIEDAASVKYYNINGVQTAQPKGVTIKVTTGKNGKVNAQKVLVK